MLNKRDFLACTAAAAVGPAVSAHAALASVGAPAQVPLATASLAHWQACLNQPFELLAAGRSHPVHLQAVTAADASPGGAHTEQFVLRFAGLAGEKLPCGLLTLRHADGQTATLFVRADSPGLVHAEFNRLLA
jgi:hypothetical protein